MDTHKLLAFLTNFILHLAAKFWSEASQFQIFCSPDQLAECSAQLSSNYPGLSSSDCVLRLTQVPETCLCACTV